MCGICGIASPPGPPDADRLATMSAALVHRGPDSAGVAVYRNPAPDGWSKLTLYSSDPAMRWAELGFDLVETRARHAVVLAEGDADEIEARILRERPELILITDDVYAPFVEGFRSLAAAAPANTVLLLVSSIMIGSLALLADLVVRSRDGV